MTDRNLDIGYVFTKTFSITGQRLKDLVILAVIIVGVPSLVLGLISSQIMAEAVSEGTIPQFSLGFWLVSIIAGLLPLILQAAVVHTTVETMSGREPDFNSSLSVALRLFLPLIGLSILMSLGIFIGFMLLIVPGLILITLWAVAVPAFVTERTGIIRAFGRSMELTEGQRWRIFALIVIAWIAMFIVGLFIAALGGAGYQGMPSSFWDVFLNSIVSTAAGVLSSVGVSVLYVHLRDLKEGTTLETIGDVFR
ncbi:hypothetical protein [Henriciella sp.]|uniref:hypothetical protein n=1 Tax=Henriciella sp. TaxID=1968823 RepID=UPI002620F089|nr:hypothetical protein [Henriciella sp.]